MSIHEAYPSIEQFRSAIRSVKLAAQYVGQDAEDRPVYDPLRPIPTLKCEGSVKIHGTHGDICFNRETNEIWFQSRESIIFAGKDNAGMAAHFSEKDLSFIKNIPGQLIVVAGEWCGKGIQKKVGIAELSKRFVIFDIKVDNKWLSKEEVVKVKDEENGVYNIYDFPLFEIEIDFSKPDESQNKLVAITTEVADRCPVAAKFGIEGIGEGVVWRCVTQGWESPKFWFKVKDERHQSSTIKVLQPVNEEKNATLREIADRVTPEWRLEQMLEKACDLNNGGDINRKHLGDFLRFVAQDIIKEESDILESFDIKEVMKFASDKARKYFFQKEALR